MFIFIFFFFQAEVGIRDIGVTGVQTCALPIFRPYRSTHQEASRRSRPGRGSSRGRSSRDRARCAPRAAHPRLRRSEERHVAKECRSRWSPYHEKKKKKSTQ